MTTKVACPGCSQHIEADELQLDDVMAAGDSITCPTCNAPFVPTADMIIPVPVAGYDVEGQKRIEILRTLKAGLESCELKFRVKIEVVDDSQGRSSPDC